MLFLDKYEVFFSWKISSNAVSSSYILLKIILDHKIPQHDSVTCRRGSGGVVVAESAWDRLAQIMRARPNYRIIMKMSGPATLICKHEAS